MNRQLRTLSVWAIVLFVSGTLDKILEQPKRLIAQILPMSLFRLDRETWLALALTFSTALAAWIIGCVAGYGVGVFAACTQVPAAQGGRFPAAGKTVDKIVDWIYIIPFVLVTSLAYSLAFPLHVDYGVPRIVIFFILVTVCGLPLGGYHVYKSVFDAVRSASSSDQRLTESLYFQGKGVLFRAWFVVNKLVDCRIASFCAAIRTSLHLSIVSVMIVESVTPRFYELLFPSTGVPEAWTVGAGRLILTAQNDYQYEKIAGCIWAVLLFDSLCVFLVELAMHRRWLRYYRGLTND
jgi:hypothetical protein